MGLREAPREMVVADLPPPIPDRYSLLNTTIHLGITRVKMIFLDNLFVKIGKNL